MPMFHCLFATHSTMLVEHESKEEATVIATQAADGEVPTRVRQWLKNTFVADVYLDVDEGDEGEVEDLVVDPLPHIAELLYEWEEDVVAGGTLVARVTLCGDENLDEQDRAVKCALPPHTTGDHRSADGLEWP